jgi:ABC-type transporter Mla MlaB component
MTSPRAKPTAPFTATCVRGPNNVLVRVSGRLVNPFEPLRSWPNCLELPVPDVRVDLGEVTEIDARGLGMLADLTRRTRAQGGKVAVVSASPRVHRLLHLTRLDALLQTGGADPLAA